MALGTVPPRLWGRVVADLGEAGAVGLVRPIRRVARLCQRGGPYCTQGVSVLWCAHDGLHLPMRCGLDPDGKATVGLHQPTPRVAEYLARRGLRPPSSDTLLAGGEAVPGLHQPMPRVVEPSCIHVVADTLLDVDSDSDTAPTELEVSSSDEEDVIIGVLAFAARVTWAVPEAVIIFVASVGKGRCIPYQKRVTRPRKTLQDIAPSSGDSEDEDSDDYGGEQLYQPYPEPAAEHLLDPFLLLLRGSDVTAVVASAGAHEQSALFQSGWLVLFSKQVRRRNSENYPHGMFDADSAFSHCRHRPHVQQSTPELCRSL